MLPTEHPEAVSWSAGVPRLIKVKKGFLVLDIFGSPLRARKAPACPRYPGAVNEKLADELATHRTLAVSQNRDAPIRMALDPSGAQERVDLGQRRDPSC